MKERFQREFDPWARRVRACLATRTVLTWLSAGLCVGALLAVGAWLAYRPSLRLMVGFAAGGLATAAGALIARRRRWSDHDVALFLDARLAADEAICTAVALSSTAIEPPPAFDVVVGVAIDKLASADMRRVRPRLLQRFHAAAPFAALAIIVLARVPERRRPIPALPPGSTVVRLADVRGLEVIERLRDAPVRDAAQRQRLDHIADDARRLRERLQNGMPQRDALDQIARLRDRIAAERLPFAGLEERRGLESAAGRLVHRGLTDAARALGDHDLAALDRAMERLANAREAADRARARDALEEARDAAEREGASELAQALREQQGRMAEREARNAVLREMAAELSNDPRVARASERLDRERTDAAARELGRVIDDALARMNSEERQALADRLRQRTGEREIPGPQHGQQGSSGSQGAQNGQQVQGGVQAERNPQQESSAQVGQQTRRPTESPSNQDAQNTQSMLQAIANRIDPRTAQGAQQSQSPEGEGNRQAQSAQRGAQPEGLQEMQAGQHAEAEHSSQRTQQRESAQGPVSQYAQGPAPIGPSAIEQALDHAGRGTQQAEQQVANGPQNAAQVPSQSGGQRTHDGQQGQNGQQGQMSRAGQSGQSGLARENGQGAQNEQNQSVQNGAESSGQGSQRQSTRGGQGQSAQSAQREQQQPNGQNPQDGSGGRGEGAPGNHRGSTLSLHGGDTLQARAGAQVRPGAPMPGGTTSIAPGRPGGTAAVRGTGDLRAVGPAEIQAVEGSQVPAEYREQVRRYFQP